MAIERSISTINYSQFDPELVNRGIVVMSALQRGLAMYAPLAAMEQLVRSSDPDLQIPINPNVLLPYFTHESRRPGLCLDLTGGSIFEMDLLRVPNGCLFVPARNGFAYVSDNHSGKKGYAVEIVSFLSEAVGFLVETGEEYRRSLRTGHESIFH
jgi:hypothetical protein